MSYKLEKGVKGRRFLLSVILLVIAGAAVGAWLHWHHNSNPAPKTTSPVPAAISQAVNFPIYYPDPSKLPTGFSLNTNSFKVVSDQAVIYSISYGNNQKLQISEQSKPTADELSNFNKKYIPVHRQTLTLVGTATIGAIGNQTVVSLPTDKNTWIIITGPSDIYASNNLTQVIQSIIKSS